MCVGLVINSIICLYINAYYTKKYFTISFFQQIKDIFPSLLLSVSMGVIIFLLTWLRFSDIFILILGFSTGCLYYIGIAAIFKMKEWKELIIICKNLSIKL
jgi:teichuronic acid exporter